MSGADRRVPEEVTAALTVKIGEVSRTSRKQLALVHFSFLMSEGFDVFCAKASACTDRELQSFRGEPHIRQDPALYMRPGAHSKQAELVELTESNFESRVARSYSNFLKRRTDGAFYCEVYVYVRKVSDLQPKHRRNRAAAVASQVALHVESLPDNQVPSSDVEGAAATNGQRVVDFEAAPVTGEAVGEKRKRAVQVEEEEMQRQYYQSFRSQHVDGYRPVRMIMNGTIVPIQVNVLDLIACLTGDQQQSPPGSTTQESIRSGGNGTANSTDEL
ncbi:hypothetical protein PHYBOEH_007206 [Phytophthora boehmeriae]|uniref:Uncharacterized protein n=1 Tax=Phytophthora boehmeriae TaxID=109152 RepID=A0A8T1W9G1_9STRA|nr:hypothetical protein PHYBOEH_007206 [Phytophthora boehmeriae]